MEWTDETIARLRSLWANGHSTAEIGRRIGASKNAVVGKAHRLELTPRPSPIRRDGMASAMPRPAAARRLTGSTLPPLGTAPAPTLPALLSVPRDEIGQTEHAARAEVAPPESAPAPPDAAPSYAAPSFPAPADAAPAAEVARKVVVEARPAPVLVVAPPRRSRTVACCWPLGDPGTPSFRFCDAEAATGKPYCAEHAAVAYVKVRDRREEVAEPPSFVARLAR